MTKADIPQNTSPEVRALIEAMLSADYDVQTTAIRHLGALGEGASPAIPFLVQIWANDPGLLRMWALDALNHIGDAAADAMAAKLASAPAKQRATIANELGQCESWKTRRTVLPLLDDPDAEVRLAAVGSLYRCTDERVLKPLLHSLNDPDAKVRVAAIQHFRELPNPAASEPMFTLLKDRDPSVREEAIRCSHYIRDPRVIPVLIDMMLDRREPDNVRCEAALVLWFSKDQRALAPYLAILKDRRTTTSLRSCAARGLGNFADKSAIDSLAAAASDKYEPMTVRIAAANSLTRFNEQRNLPLFTKLITGEDDRTLRFYAAVGAVRLTGGAIDDLRFVNALKEFEPDSEVGEVEECEKSHSLKLIAEHGKTESVRSMAKKLSQR